MSPAPSPAVQVGRVLGAPALRKDTRAVLAAEELSNMASELAKYGLQLPSFSKIGGILAHELSVDEAAGRGVALPCRGVGVG